MNADIAANDRSPTRMRRAPPWFRVVGGLGTLWNAYGVFQFVQATIATRDSLVAMGMTEVQAQTLYSCPAWMTVAFAVGALGGLLGSVLLLLRRKIAAPALIASLAGYVLLYIGDITEGVFAAIGTGQVAILSLVVVIACGLLWASRHADRNGVLA